MGVLIALVNIMETKLTDSKIIKLGELGSLRPSLSSEGMSKESEVTQHAIKGAKVIFRPGARIKKALAGADFQKA